MSLLKQNFELPEKREAEISEQRKKYEAEAGARASHRDKQLPFLERLLKKNKTNLIDIIHEDAIEEDKIRQVYEKKIENLEEKLKTSKENFPDFYSLSESIKRMYILRYLSGNKEDLYQFSKAANSMSFHHNHHDGDESEFDKRYLMPLMQAIIENGDYEIWTEKYDPDNPKNFYHELSHIVDEEWYEKGDYPGKKEYFEYEDEDIIEIWQTVRLEIIQALDKIRGDKRNITTKLREAVGARDIHGFEEEALKWLEDDDKKRFLYLSRDTQQLRKLIAELDMPCNFVFGQFSEYIDHYDIYG